jgi:hypothetical protein
MVPVGRSQPLAMFLASMPNEVAALIDEAAIATSKARLVA